MKKTLPISIWLALALIGIITIAIISMVSIRGIVNVLFSQHLDTTQQVKNDTAFREISTNISRWGDLSWQRTMNSKLLAMQVTVVIQDVSGHTIYRSNPAFIASPANASQMIVVMSGTRQQRVAFLYKGEVGASEIQQIIEIGAIMLFVVLLGAAWFIGRMILHPLQKITYAARQIANNNLDCYLPSSSVREIADFSRAFGVMRDALRASLERQAEMEQERRLFISAIAHDLRTPLFALRGYLEGLTNGLTNTPEKTSKYIGICKEKADLLARLVADLFAYTQLEYLEQKPHFERLELGFLWKQTAEGFLPQTEEKKISLVLDGMQECCFIEGDAYTLMRAMGNLLDNALRHTPTGGIIRISWYQEAEHITFTVTDTGSGIAPHDLPHLFTPLYRGNPSRNPQTGGAGLGLTIAQRVLRVHGGELTATNTPAGGAAFIGVLPCK